ncbi:hypothetical protein [Vibrio europaeus]|uniref:Uncharacterized protein n=1 Tax=Vibrio europaeus TaxID=300876 RepID=A0ABT5GRS4_9VIBR|nr:hypothetical protein [Vibrio europaeus]MDC5725679.1 hypothetical protein [Vibrio europaeus]MDC5728281.1 hypothetical protein [Vibrio europaeus]MDC5734493.1 hypothetical protein [Vibrio europaeus]MDC5739774.1 hypothetical protein [Vibrio europaeus]
MQKALWLISNPIYRGKTMIKILISYLFKSPAQTQFIMGFLILVNPGAWTETSIPFFNGWFGVGLVVASIWFGVAPKIYEQVVMKNKNAQNLNLYQNKREELCILDKCE